MGLFVRGLLVRVLVVWFGLVVVGFGCCAFGLICWLVWILGVQILGLFGLRLRCLIWVVVLGVGALRYLLFVVGCVVG